MTITAEQIRAARALLNWKQSDLAEKSGLSLPSINNIERQIGSPRLSTLETIRNALQGAGIEFIGSNGVQKHNEVFEMKEFQGDDFIERLNDDLLFCMRSPEDVVMMFGIDDSMYPKYVPEQTVRYYDHQAKTGFTEMTLVKEDDNFFLSHVEVYRWTLPQTMGLVPYYVYHDRVAMIMWEKKRVVLIRSKDIADTFRAQFEFLWSQAKRIPKNSVNLMDDPVYRAKLYDKIKK
jgi:transcriptional regulator with XRE-family HTH domain